MKPAFVRRRATIYKNKKRRGGRAKEGDPDPLAVKSLLSFDGDARNTAKKRLQEKWTRSTGKFILIEHG